MLTNLRRYAAVFTAALVFGGLLVALLEWISTWDVPTAFMTILPPMIAAMLEGDRIGKETGVPLPKRAWIGEAVAMTAVAVAVKLVLGGMIMALLVQGGLVEPVPWGLVGLVVGFDILATFAANGFFLVMGVRNELRSRSR